MAQTEDKNNKHVKLFLWTIITVVVMFVLPILILLVTCEFNSSAAIDVTPMSLMALFLAPAYSVIIGVVAGKEVKRCWILPVLSSVLFVVAIVIYAIRINLLITTFFLLFILFGLAVYLLIGIITMLISACVRKKKIGVSKRVAVLTITGIIVFLIVISLIPIKSGYLDGGTVEYNAIAYSVVKYHRFISDECEIENMFYYYPGQTRVLTGTVISVLGHTVYDTTHMEPENPAPSHSDEINDFVENYNRFQNNNHPIHGIELCDDAGIYLFSHVSPEELLKISQFIIGYCENNPNHVFNQTDSINIRTADYEISIDTESLTIPQYSINYDDIVELLSSNLTFEDVQRVYITGNNNSLTDDELTAVEQLFPNADIVF